MTNQSIRVPEGWTIGHVHGRYETTRFVFVYSGGDETDLFVQLIGDTSDKSRTEYHLHVSTDESVEIEEPHGIHVTTFSSEAAAMQGTQDLMEQLTAAIEADEIRLGSHRTADLEAFLEQFSPEQRGGWLTVLRHRVC